MKLLFDEARAFLYVSDSFGCNIDLNPTQALELLDFLQQRAQDIRGYALVDESFEAEKDMRALDKALEQTAWAVYLEESNNPLEQTVSMPAVKVE